MNHQRLSSILSLGDNVALYSLLTDLNIKLSGSADALADFDYTLCLEQLIDLVDRVSKAQQAPGLDVTPEITSISLTTIKLVSSNLLLAFAHLPMKVFDFANKLLGGVSEDTSNPVQFKINTLLLVDLFQLFPSVLGSLNNFAAQQIYKYLKKKPQVSASIVYLLAVVVGNSTKLDMDDKFQQKLLKIASKNVVLTMERDDPTVAEPSTASSDLTTSILLKRNYYILLKNLLILSVSTHYETLLAQTASSSGPSSSALSKAKPDSLMNSQHVYQLSLLNSYEKVIHSGLSNYEREVRLVTVELVANLLINFIPTGKFNAIQYLLDQYKLPLLNNWDLKLTRQVDDITTMDHLDEETKRSNTFSTHDSSSIINTSTNLLLRQSSVIESLLLYIQLEQVQNLDYLSTNLITILDGILTKFGELNLSLNHFQNQEWNKTLLQWTAVIAWMIKECGNSCHDMLMNFVYERFYERQPDNTVSPVIATSKSKKRESGIFGFKGKSKSDKEKEGKMKEINPYKNSYQCHLLLKIVDQLIPLGVSGAVDEKEEQVSIASESETTTADVIDETVSHSSSFIREILFKLIINDNSYIRTYSLETLLIYSSFHSVEVNKLILKAFKLINTEFKQTNLSNPTSTNENISSTSSIRLINYSLTLSALIKHSTYTSIQTSTIIKILSFCTQNLKQQLKNSGDCYMKSSCWIILTALITMYNESEFVKLNSSQFLVFWKSLLTSQYLGGLEISDVVDNLRIRNFALCCLLNYLNTADLTPESLKQFQLLLAKSYNYITYLENSYEVVGQTTTFNHQFFNQADYNVDLLNNIQYSNYDVQQFSNEKAMISLILYHKKILLQSYKKIGGFLKNDINSNMVIFLLKLFSDNKIFCRTTLGDFNVKEVKGKKKGAVAVTDSDDEQWLFYDDANYEFGVTSRKLDAINAEPVTGDIFYNDPFDSPPANDWTGYFNQIAFANASSSSIYDPNVFIVSNLESTTLVTSLIDLSIDLFQIVFPYFPLKIQMSLLEQMRNSLTSKTTDPFRLKAISINISMVLNGLSRKLKSTKSLTFDKLIISTMLDILSKINGNKRLIKINAETFGELTTVENAQTQISKCINDIVETLDPLKRGESILKIANVFKVTSFGLGEIYGVISQLLNDPNPIVYHYTLESCVMIFEKAPLENHLEVIEKIFDNHCLNDSFGSDIQSKILINSKCKYGSIGITSKILKLAITLLGPNLRESTDSIRSHIKNLIILLNAGIGCATIEDSFEVSKQLLLMFQELIIFDPTLIEDEVKYISKYLDFVISKNLKIGIHSNSPTSLYSDALFPFNSSFELYKLAYSCYCEMMKILGPEAILNNELVNLLWISLNLKPCQELKEMIRFWMQSSVETGNWFNTLSGIFKFSAKKLVSQFMELNYQQKLLPLLQRQKKKHNNSGSGLDFNDEESQNIVNEESSTNGANKNEPITWEFKLFILDLLNELLSLATRNPKLKLHLKGKIQDIVNISFLGSTSPINSVRKQGIHLLDKALGLFGDTPDPLYPSVSILEQQQAQIISALMPCFLSECDAELLVETINILSKFINLPRIKFYSKQRILKTLIDLLEEISSNKFLRFDYLENLSEYNKKSIQLAILNCWAILRLDLERSHGSVSEEDGEETGLAQILKKYSKLLISLWIVVLREFSTIKYEEPKLYDEISIYGNYWINFISVLSLEMEDKSSYVHSSLGNDSGNFFFILFSQCVESLVKGRNSDSGNTNDFEVVGVLKTINRLVKSSDELVVNYIFNDEIFGELIDLFDRIILIDDDLEVQCQLIEILNETFKVAISRGQLNEGGTSTSFLS